MIWSIDYWKNVGAIVKVDEINVQHCSCADEDEVEGMSKEWNLGR